MPIDHDYENSQEAKNDELLAKELYEYLECIDPTMDAEDATWEKLDDSSKPFWIAAAHHVIFIALCEGIVVRPS